MKAKVKENWHEANQRYLMAAFALVREALKRHAGRADEPDSRADDSGDLKAALDQAAAGLPAASTLDTLCESFGLSHFERDILLLCAGIELDGTFAALCGQAQADARKAYPTFGLALAALPEPHWSAITPDAALRRWRLIEVGAGDALTTNPIRIDERILHYLAGISHVDDRLHGLLELIRPPAEIPASHRDTARRIGGIWSQQRASSEIPVVQLCGNESSAKRSIAALTCNAIGRQLYAIRAADIPAAVSEREALARLWDREAILSGRVLLLDIEEVENPDSVRSVVSFVQRVQSLLLVATREPLRLRNRTAVRIDVTKPTTAEQRALWDKALRPMGRNLDRQIESVLAHFNLSANGIQSASADILTGASLVPEDRIDVFIWEACRSQARTRLNDLAQRIESSVGWDDLVLPDSQLQILHDVSAHVRRRLKVYEDWGFASASGRGLGISALFAGASGTGKTLAAEVLANDLQLDLYRIDLSSVVSKYIGETEKNLRRLFDAAEEGGAILLFDEADALFGKRSEVKDSHDRYANIEVSYLLQRMEAYRGLAILTTNMKTALDTAFLRRIRFIVQFPFPDAAQRAEIWRHMFPRATPTERLDFEKLARLNVAGGNIRNIALNAAFLAADADETVRMSHVLRAARSEYTKLERPLTEQETRGWT